MAKPKKTTDNMIATNRKANHDYIIETKFEAGIALLGWEVKSLRARQAQLKESYVVMRKGEAYLLNAHITPLKTASTHITPDPTRTRKLLLHKKELNQLIGAVEQKGYTLVPLHLHFKHNRVKLMFGLGKGKKKYDKRQSDKEASWKREQARIFKK